MSELTALPMHLARHEEALYAEALAKIDDQGSEAQRNEATFIRQQLALHESYINACAKLEKFGSDMRERGDPLVPVRFPIRLTPKTRECVENGMFRSFLRFLQDLHAVVIAQHVSGVDDCVTDVDAFLTRVANVLTLESCRVLDRGVELREARNVCISYIEKCRRDVVLAECTHMESLDKACDVVIECMRRFSRESGKISRGGVVTRMRAFLKTAERKGLSAAAARMVEERQLRCVVETHSWMRGGKFDDARVERVYALLVLSHDDLAHSLMWHRRRISSLRATNPANRCWCGLAVGPGVDGELLTAPAHLRVFAGEERMRVSKQQLDVAHVCYLSAVSVANIVLELIRERRLTLSRVGAAYASRVLTFDFCKYETAAQNILEDTVRPWYARVELGEV